MSCVGQEVLFSGLIVQINESRSCGIGVGEYFFSMEYYNPVIICSPGLTYFASSACSFVKPGPYLEGKGQIFNHSSFVERLNCFFITTSGFSYKIYPKCAFCGYVFQLLRWRENASEHIAFQNFLGRPPRSPPSASHRTSHLRCSP
jgi:hypothetical protein